MIYLDQIILDAAATVFSKKGFSATKIQDIAEEAKVEEQSLSIYKDDKIALWRAAKNHLVSKVPNNLDFTEVNDLENFLKIILNQKIEILKSDKRIPQLIKWQLIEENITELMGGSIYFPTSWKTKIIELQEIGEVDPSLNPNFIIYIVNEILLSVSYERYNSFLHSPQERAEFLDNLIQWLIKALKK